MDSHIATNALECQTRKAVVLRTIGLVSNKQVGISPEKPDWQNQLKDLNTDSVDQRVFEIVCSSAPSQGPAREQAEGAPQPSISGSAKLVSGSGIFVDADGYVLTNLHVVNGCKTIAVKALRQPAVPGAVEAADPKNDLALIRIRDGYGAPMTFRSQDRPARLGENIMIMGYPLYGILSNEPKATFGQFNSVACINNDYTLLQVSAPVQPGNSGGPVLDESGLVVGVVVSELSPQIVGRIGAIPQNVNFAIRGELAQIFMAAHGVPFTQEVSGHRLRNDEIAARAEASTAQVFCLKP